MAVPTLSPVSQAFAAEQVLPVGRDEGARGAARCSEGQQQTEGDDAMEIHGQYGKRLGPSTNEGAFVRITIFEVDPPTKLSAGIPGTVAGKNSTSRSGRTRNGDTAKRGSPPPESWAISPGMSVE